MIRAVPKQLLFGYGFIVLAALALAFLPLSNALFVTFGALLFGALLLYPQVAVYLLVFAVPFGSLLPLNVGGAKVTAADALLLGAWALYLMRGIARRKIALRFPPLTLPFVLFLFAAAVSITVARSLPDSISELTKWIEMLAAYWLIALYFDRADVERLLAVMFCAGLAEALLGAYQYYFRVGPEGFLLFGGANLRAYGTFEQPNPYAGYLGLILPLALGTGLGLLVMFLRRERTPFRSMPLRSTAFRSMPLRSTALRSTALRSTALRSTALRSTALRSTAFRSTAFRSTAFRSTAFRSMPVRSARVEGNAAASVPYAIFVFCLASLALGAMLAALFFSYSRGAWIGVAAALGVTTLLVLVRSKRAATLAIVSGLVVLIGIGLGEINLVPNIVAERFATVGDYFNFEDVRGVRANDENFALVERRAHWQAALGMFEDSPWVGVGFGNYAAAYPQYALPKWDDPLGHAHNYYLNVLAEAGGMGFVAYLILWSAMFWVVGRAALHESSAFKRGILAGALGALVTLSIHNFFDNLFVHAMYIQVGLTLGMVQALKDNG